MTGSGSNQLELTGGKPLKGEITVPGDKSISHRALLLGSLATGESFVRNIAPGEDLRSMVSCLSQLGVEIQDGNDGISVLGKGLMNYTPPGSALDAGNSGTLIRLLTGVLCGQNFTSVITGDESLRSRPMKRIVVPLKKMEAEVISEDGHAPLKIEGGGLKGIVYRPKVASAQVKSCVLLAGLAAEGRTVVVEPGPSRDHTERMLKAMDYPVKVEENVIEVDGPQQLSPINSTVPGDFSSASYFIAAALILEGSEILIRKVGLNSTRTGFLDLINKMGASVSVENRRTESEEPVGDIFVTYSDLKSVELSGSDVVKAIDELPLLGVLATQARGTTTVTDAEELRVKETDRIKATVDNLRRLGADAHELQDGFVVEGQAPLSGGSVDSYMDHRIAMSMAVAAQVSDGKTTIVDPKWVEVSFPGFFDKLEELKDG